MKQANEVNADNGWRAIEVLVQTGSHLIADEVIFDYKTINGWRKKMRNVKVYITLKQGVVDPQGNQAGKALQAMGHEDAKNIRIGKLIEMQVQDGPNLEEKVKEMCEQLLVNLEVEQYRFEIEGA